MEGLARLRNLLVHKYWVIRDELIHANIRRDFRCVEEFIGRVRELARG
ncbi:MAG: HepT-like ribonuclease domain-containing protein [Acidilobaceae archaeon]